MQKIVIMEKMHRQMNLYRLEHQPIFDTYTGIDKNINDVIMMLLENTNKSNESNHK